MTCSRSDGVSVMDVPSGLSGTKLGGGAEGRAAASVITITRRVNRPCEHRFVVREACQAILPMRVKSGR